MNQSNPVYSKDTNIVFRKIAGEYILVPLKSRVRELKSIYTLNEVAARVWELIDRKKRVSEIKEILLSEFEVNPADLEKDLEDLLCQLLEAQLIREA